MQMLNARVEFSDFLEALETAKQRLLMLDYDGTLAPFRIRPEHAAPYPGVIEMLGDLLERKDLRIVIVSGRRASEIRALLPPTIRLEIVGAHGWERLFPDGTGYVREPDTSVRRSLALAEAAAIELRYFGARVERKPGSVAVHWRGLPVLTVERFRAMLTAAWRLVADADLEVLPFDGGLELRARGVNKRTAVDAILSESAPDVVAAYLGDDITDEEAFHAVKARGLAVLVRSHYRETAADLWIKPPHELLAFIELWGQRGGAQ